MTAAGLLGVALGAAGSGRQRYARAMALHRLGGLTPAQLEAYRVAAASDTAPPEAVFADRRTSLPEGPATAIRLLLVEVDLYLQTLPGPGVAAVREGLSRFGAGPVTPAAPAPNAVLDAHLPAALAALRASHPGLAEAIASARPHLRWITYDGYDPALIGASFAGGHAFASLIGPEASVPAPDFDLGLFLIAPHVLYRDRCHAAPELYAPLTGPHGWRFAPGDPLTVLPAHQPVWNPPHQPHLTKVGPVPFLCIFVWTRDVQELAQVVAASDWPALEAMRLAP